MRAAISTAVLLASCVGLALAQSEVSKPIADRDFSLAHESVFEVGPPPPVHPNASDPGERPLPGRGQPDGPPAIPHAIDDFLPITRTENACVDCHQVETKEPGEPTPIPSSHYVDYRDRPGIVGEKMAAERWVCVSCHVGQTDAGPLVANAMTATPETSAEEQGAK